MRTVLLTLCAALLLFGCEDKKETTKNGAKGDTSAKASASGSSKAKATPSATGSAAEGDEGGW